jgi:hypothetical protein
LFKKPKFPDASEVRKIEEAEDLLGLLQSLDGRHTA